MKPGFNVLMLNSRPEGAGCRNTVSQIGIVGANLKPLNGKLVLKTILNQKIQFFMYDVQEIDWVGRVEIVDDGGST